MPEALIIPAVVAVVFLVGFGFPAVALAETPEQIGPLFKRMVREFFFVELPTALAWVLRAVLSFFPNPETQEGEAL